MPDAQAAELLDYLDPGEAASIVNEMDSDEAADVLAEMDREDVEEILSLMDADEAAEARQLIDFDPETAGGLMMKEFLSYPGTMTISDAVADIAVQGEDYPIYYLQHIFVVGTVGPPAGRCRAHRHRQGQARFNPGGARHPGRCGQSLRRT